MKILLLTIFILSFIPNVYAEDGKVENILDSDILATDDIYNSKIKQKREARYARYDMPNQNYVFAGRYHIGHRRSSDQVIIPYIMIEADTEAEFIKKQNDKIVAIIDHAVCFQTHGTIDNLEYHLRFVQNLLIGSGGTPKNVLIHPETFKRIFPKIEDRIFYKKDDIVLFDNKRIIFSEHVKEGDIYFMIDHDKLGVVAIKKPYDGKGGEVGFIVKRDMVSKLIIK